MLVIINNDMGNIQSVANAMSKLGVTFIVSNDIATIKQASSLIFPGVGAFGRCMEVLEARDHFSRLQVLHLWDWVEADLIELGIKIIDPSIFAAVDLRRCSTAQLQHSLLKVCLLLGVRVRFHCHVHSLKDVARLVAQPRAVEERPRLLDRQQQQLSGAAPLN